jgi:hypothetical protein
MVNIGRYYPHKQVFGVFFKCIKSSQDKNVRKLLAEFCHVIYSLIKHLLNIYFIVNSQLNVRETEIRDRPLV